MPATPPIRSKPVSRRTVLKAGGTLLLSVLAPMSAQAAQILAVRVWPAEDYTRVTLENDTDLKVKHFLVPDPDRLVVDIEGLVLNSTLKSLVAKIESNDPYIKEVRVGQNRPNVVRLVFDLKEKVTPQVFTLEPVGNYKHRLIFDLYPVKATDPIAALIEKGEWSQDEKDGATVAQQPAPAGQPAAPGQAGGASSSTQGASSQAGVTASAPSTGTSAPGQSPAIAAQSGKPAPGEPEPAPAHHKPGQKPGPEKMVRMLTIALDPGHGGEDPGAMGARGSREKDIVLAIAKRLKEKIEDHPNMRVMLTRDGDYFVPLGKRVEKARKVDADLFVSIHADAFVKTSARGSSVFVLSEKGATSSAARWLADKENQADLIGGANAKGHDPQLASVLFDLSTTAQINDSMKVGKAVLGEIGGINKLHKGSVEQAGFAVLKAPDIPSILIETAFISNPEEEARLLDDEYQDKIADAIVKGIRRYFAKNPPLSKNRLT
ncbi:MULTISPECIES: N-acetylmuramoyl-L-alanine amidase [unclassified Duganella]|uniref:N-acetylmuramoyl-L-alanine amidase n=1 Tax=unclassified Duganella TaxID=2636909 RepID=UPI0006F559C3|nr:MULTISPECIES: N-acetylmuramoyl-L-alanine amidase [unclassified Duganella]KQV53836.1 N-acetylmuramoyl-L-alanine amidase [Duganella sp. Root336D2]KRB83610.1 N-acetylmuramoyl-L-alanine amidase [Duganella sp. Root198D2]